MFGRGTPAECSAQRRGERTQMRIMGAEEPQTAWITRAPRSGSRGYCGTRFSFSGLLDGLFNDGALPIRKHALAVSAVRTFARETIDEDCATA